MNESVRDVVVVGGGPAGLAAACAYGRAGFATTLIDRRAAPEPARDETLVFAFTSATRDRLIDLGLWADVMEDVWPISGVNLQDAISCRAHVFRARCGRAGLLYSIGYGELRRRLTKLAASFPTVECIHGRRLAALPLDGTARRVVLDDGYALRTQLVIGADGRRSTVRELAGLSSRATDFAETALTFTVAGRSLAPDTAIERLTPNGPISIVPLGGCRFAVAWIDSTARSQRRRTSTPARLLAELAGALDLDSDHDLELVSKITAQKLSVANADRYVAPRLVLIGDAAHGGHPIPVQGAHMAVADVHELTTLRRVDRSRFASAETLACFQRSRRLANAARLGLVDVLNRMFPPSVAPLAFALPGPDADADRRPALSLGAHVSP